MRLYAGAGAETLWSRSIGFGDGAAKSASSLCQISPFPPLAKEGKGEFPVECVSHAMFQSPEG